MTKTLNVLTAKLVLQKTEHMLIVEDGAQKFALESNFPTLSPSQLIVTTDSITSLQEEDNGKNKEYNGEKI